MSSCTPALWGWAHGLQQVLEAARRLREAIDFLFVFVGEGAEKNKLKQLATDWNLRNVQLIDQQPKARIPLFYAACDLGLVSLRDTPLFQEVLPSKLFEYLGMERPVLCNVGGEARQVLEDSGGGEYVPSGDVPALASAVRRLSLGREKLSAMGRAGRQFVLENFDRRRQAGQYLGILEAMVYPTIHKIPTPPTRSAAG